MPDLSDLRRSHQCHRDGCDSEAKWRVGLNFRCIGHNAPMFDAMSTIRVCDDHCNDAAKMMLSGGNKERIAAGLIKDGIQIPDFSSAVVAFVRVADTKEEAA